MKVPGIFKLLVSIVVIVELFVGILLFQMSVAFAGLSVGSIVIAIVTLAIAVPLIIFLLKKNGS